MANEELFSIGEFSRATGLTVKALRFYHEQGVLKPAYVDPDNGYRFYAISQIDSAGVIAKLRELDFSVKTIAEIVRDCDDEEDILELLESHLDEIAQQLQHLLGIRQAISLIVTFALSDFPLTSRGQGHQVTGELDDFLWERPTGGDRR